VQVKNILKAFDCYPQLMQLIRDLLAAEEIIDTIYNINDVNYDMARETVKAEEAVRLCITLYQKGTLNNFNEQIRKEQN